MFAACFMFVNCCLLRVVCVCYLIICKFLMLVDVYCVLNCVLFRDCRVLCCEFDVYLLIERCYLLLV